MTPESTRLDLLASLSKSMPDIEPREAPATAQSLSEILTNKDFELKFPALKSNPEMPSIKNTSGSPSSPS